MSIHIGCEPELIAPRVLLPGDPLRASWIAETFLDDPQRYTNVRGMVGYTGRFAGEPVSVQGTGMGMPSLSIYVNELIREYDVRQLVRVGSCGALTDALKLRDVVLAIGASTDSSMNRIRFEGFDFSATADFGLLRAAADTAAAREVPVTVAGIFSTDNFYSDRPELVTRLAQYGVVAVDMEANALYTLAAGHGRKALTICTVSDHLLTGEASTSAEREQTFGSMVRIGLAAMVATPLD